MESIDWNVAYEKARNFGTGLAEFLNGLFEGYNGKTLFGEVGKTIASALNTVVYSALSFGETFDFKQFGYNIADGINNFFRTFDFGALAKTINVWVDGIFDLIATTIKEKDKNAIFDAFIDFFGNLELDTVAIVIGAISIKKIGKIVWGFALGTVLKPLAHTFLLNLGATLTADVGTVLGAGTFAGIAATIGFGIVGALTSWFAGQEVGKLIGRLIFPEDADWYKDFSWFGEDGFFKTILIDLETSLDGLNKMLTDWTNNPVLTLFANTAHSLMTDPLNVFNIQLENLKNNKSIQEWFNANVQPWFTKEKWKNLAENIPNAIKEKWNEFTSWWQNTAIVSWWNNNVAPWFTKEKWKNVGQGIKDGITGIWSDFVSWWQGTAIGNWWNNNVAPWFSKEKWNFSGIKDGVSSAFQGAIEAIKQKWNSFANTLNSILKINIQPVIVGGKTIFSGGVLNLGVIPTFAQGGFPEDGWFRASQGEMIGKFDNGQSVVANNNQITDGISAAVQRGNQQMIGYMQEEIVELRKQNEFLMQIAGKSFGITKEQIGENARSWAMEYTMRTGNEAYSF